MKKLSKKRLKELEREVKREFPESYGLQQVHLSRLIIEEKTKNLGPRELIKFYRRYGELAKSKENFKAGSS